jgi:hypothetical protein
MLGKLRRRFVKSIAGDVIAEQAAGCVRGDLATWLVLPNLSLVLDCGIV